MREGGRERGREGEREGGGGGRGCGNIKRSSYKNRSNYSHKSTAVPATPHKGRQMATERTQRAVSPHCVQTQCTFSACSL